MKRFVRTMLAAVNIPIALLFLAGYLAYHVPFGVFWWFELVAVFLPYLALVLGGMTVLLALAGNRRALVVNGVLLALFLIRANPLDRFDTVPDVPDDALTLLTFNAPAIWRDATPERPAHMARLVEESRPDVIGLQEAPIFWHDEAPFVRADPYISILFDSLDFSSMRPDNASWTQQPVFSKPSIVHVSRRRLYVSDNRTSHVIRARIRWQDRDFILYNVHLRTFGERKPWEETRSSVFDVEYIMRYFRQYRAAYRVRAREIDGIVAMIEEETLPVILCGDLNSTPNNRVYHTLSGRLRDTFAEAGEGWGMTYHARLPAVRIDYVFVSEEWEVVAARMQEAHLSDHLPLLVTLRLRD